jgi:hypothetical protein
MAPRAPYWEYFVRTEGTNKVTCSIEGCSSRVVSLGKEDVPGERKKKTGTWSLKYHLQKKHPETWAALEEEKAKTVREKEANILKKNVNDETERGTIKMFNLRTSGERKDFLSMVITLITELLYVVISER